MNIDSITKPPVINVICVAACSSMAGCAQPPSSAPSPFVTSVYQECEADPNIWKNIPAPPQREALLDLKDDQSNEPIKKYFVVSNSDVEAWFENSDHDVLACRYVRQENCGGSMFSTVIFRRSGGSWKAGPTRSKTCSD